MGRREGVRWQEKAGERVGYRERERERERERQEEQGGGFKQV